MKSMYQLFTIKSLIHTFHQLAKMNHVQDHQQVEAEPMVQPQEAMDLEGENRLNIFLIVSGFNINFDYRSGRLLPTSTDWRIQCKELWQIIWNHKDSEPFRLPVDCVDHPGK